jgi:hypothetical protein
MGEDRRDSETAEVDQCWSVVAGMGQWWSEVGARIEQGHQCSLFGRIRPQHRTNSSVSRQLEIRLFVFKLGFASEWLVLKYKVHKRIDGVKLRRCVDLLEKKCECGSFDFQTIEAFFGSVHKLSKI